MTCVICMCAGVGTAAGSMVVRVLLYDYPWLAQDPLAFCVPRCFPQLDFGSEFITMVGYTACTCHAFAAIEAALHNAPYLNDMTATYEREASEFESRQQLHADRD